jgi:putative transcription factor
MMDCELCGKKAVGKAVVENTVVSVCENCSSMGKIVHEERKVRMPDKKRIQAPDEIYFVPNFASVVKNARESLSLSREALAERIKEKSNIIDHIEKGSRPEKHVAQKLEKILKVRIISSIESERISNEKRPSDPLTLGDIVTIRKRKK